MATQEQQQTITIDEQAIAERAYQLIVKRMEHAGHSQDEPTWNLIADVIHLLSGLTDEPAPDDCLAAVARKCRRPFKESHATDIAAYQRPGPEFDTC